MKEFCLRTFNYWTQQRISADRLGSPPTVIVINGPNSEVRYSKILRWSDRHYPGYKLIQSARVKENDRYYCRQTIRTAYGQQKVVYFDITDSLIRELDTKSRLFPGGTMIRIWPPRAGRPERQEWLV